MSKPVKSICLFLCDDKGLLFEQTSKVIIKALVREGPFRAWTSSGCRRLANKPRALSMVSLEDEQQAESEDVGQNRKTC